MPGQDKRLRRYQLASLSTLKKWDKEGDEEAREVLAQRDIVRDLATNPHTKVEAPQIWLAPRFWIQFKKHTTGGRVGLWLELDEAVTLQKIKDHWSEIRQWQDFLRDWQGPEKYGIDGYLLHLHKKHREGFSYANLTRLVADSALSWLEWYQRRLPTEFEEAVTKIDHWSDQERKHYASECSAAFKYFKMAGAKDEELISAWWIDALKHLASNNKKPIKADVPVTRENIIETLRAFRKRFNMKEGVEKIS